MVIIPAIDIKDGRCVRLRQGDFQDVTVFSEHPLEQAAQFIACGARRLHLVDLDGAKQGRPQHLALFSAIAARFPDCTLQVGGGLRSQEHLETLFEHGVHYAIVGSRAIQDPAWLCAMAERFPQKILLGLDAKAGLLAISGWQETLSLSLEHFLARLPQDLPLAGIIHTDIARDGMLQGANVDHTVTLATHVSWAIYASGGIGHLSDIRAFCGTPVAGVIVGRALYEGAFSVQAALEAGQC